MGSGVSKEKKSTAIIFSRSLRGNRNPRLTEAEAFDLLNQAAGIKEQDTIDAILRRTYGWNRISPTKSLQPTDLLVQRINYTFQLSLTSEEAKAWTHIKDLYAYVARHRPENGFSIKLTYSRNVI